MMETSKLQITMIVELAAVTLLLLSAWSHAFAVQSRSSRTIAGNQIVGASSTALPAYATSTTRNSNSQAQTNSQANSKAKANSKTNSYAKDSSYVFWLKDFSIASGEIIDPYAVLKVPRKAEASQIRQSYIEQSRRYHPDGARHRKFLPGSCNNIEEVRDQWERIKLAYEILKNPRMRKRYDRHEALADPGRAVRRAATHAAVQSVVGLGRGLLDVGALAIGAIQSQAIATVLAVTQAAMHEKQQHQRSIQETNSSIETTDAPPAVTTTATPPNQKLAP